MKKKVDAFDFGERISKEVSKGVLLTTKADGKVNTMTISWGHMGTIWGKPVFIVYVRQSRHTKAMLEANGEFTINVPMGEIDKQILGFCGTKSGRDVDKIAAMGLHLEEPEVISVPGIRELPLTLECKVIYKQDQVLENIPEDVLARYYPEPDRHTVYYGQIVDAYVIE